METNFSFTVCRSPLSHLDILSQNWVDAVLEFYSTAEMDLSFAKDATQQYFDDPSLGIHYSICHLEEVIGSLYFVPQLDHLTNKKIYWVYSVYVQPKYRQKGAFSALYRFVCEEAKRDNVYSMKLYVSKENTKAQAAYEKVGMKMTEELMFEIYDLSIIKSRVVLKKDDYNNVNISVKFIDKQSLEDIKKSKFRGLTVDIELNYEGFELALLSEENVKVLVLEEDGEVIGVVGIYPEYHVGMKGFVYNAYNFMVLNKLEIEKKLEIMVDKVVEFLVDRKCCGIRLFVNSQDVEMQKAVRNIGFNDSIFRIYEQVLN